MATLSWHLHMAGKCWNRTEAGTTPPSPLPTPHFSRLSKPPRASSPVAPLCDSGKTDRSYFNRVGLYKGEAQGAHGTEHTHFQGAAFTSEPCPCPPLHPPRRSQETWVHKRSSPLIVMPHGASSFLLCASVSPAVARGSLLDPNC